MLGCESARGLPGLLPITPACWGQGESGAEGPLMLPGRGAGRREECSPRPSGVSSQWLSSGSQASLSHALSCEQSPLGTCGQLSLSSELWARDAGCVGNVGTGGGVEYVLDSAQAHASNTARGQRRARRERKREKHKAEASSQRAAVTIAVSIVAAHTS